MRGIISSTYMAVKCKVDIAGGCVWDMYAKMLGLYGHITL